MEDSPSQLPGFMRGPRVWDQKASLGCTAEEKMFSYAINPENLLLVIEDYRARPLFRFSSSVTEGEVDAVVESLAELSSRLIRSRGTFHRVPTRARLIMRWAERRRESLGVIERASGQPMAPSLTLSDPRYRSIRQAAHSFASPLCAIDDPQLFRL